MKQSCDNTTSGFGLVASGSSGRWEVSVDEALDRKSDWTLELEGPATYLVFQLRDLNVIAEVICFLQRGLNAPKTREQSPKDNALILGTFAVEDVELLWDNEGFPRCFLLIGATAKSALRLTFGEEDLRMLLEAFEQVADDLPQNASS